MAGHMGTQIGDHQAAIPARGKAGNRSHQFPRTIAAILAISAIKFRLVIEGILLGRTATHVQEDYSSGSGSEVWGFRLSGTLVVRSRLLLLAQACQGQIAEPTGRRQQHLSAVKEHG